MRSFVACSPRLRLKTLVVVLNGTQTGESSEPVWELLDDPVGQCVRHVQDVVVHGIERADILLPVLRQSRDYFVRGRGEVGVLLLTGCGGR